MFDNFWGNPQVTQALEQMVAQDRLAQTLLFAGPEGVGKATLAQVDYAPVEVELPALAPELPEAEGLAVLVIQPRAYH